MDFFVCPSCEKTIGIPDEFIGKTVICSNCHCPFFAPMDEDMISPRRANDTKTQEKAASGSRKKAAGWLFLAASLNLLILVVFVFNSLSNPDQDVRLPLIVISCFLLLVPSILEMAGANSLLSSRAKGTAIVASAMALLACLILCVMAVIFVNTRIGNLGHNPDPMHFFMVLVLVLAGVGNLGAGIVTLVAIGQGKKTTKFEPKESDE